MHTVTAMYETRIVLRNDSTVNWNANATTVLLKGEVGIEFLADGTKKIKIGDGVSTWSELGYFGESNTLTADGKSLVVEDALFKLYGFDAAEVGARPYKNADGVLEWVVPSGETVEGVQETIAEVQTDVENLETLIGTLPQNATSTTLVEYITEVVNKTVIESGGMTAEQATKLENIEPYAQVNIIEAVRLNNEKLVVSDDKSINIPIAGDTLGVVKSATGDNKVTVAEDGTMSVASINFNSITQTEGDMLILNGGSAID